MAARDSLGGARDDATSHYEIISTRDITQHIIAGFLRRHKGRAHGLRYASLAHYERNKKKQHNGA